MKKMLIYLTAFIVLLLVGNVFGQSLSLESTSGLHGPDTVLINQEITFDIRVTSDGDNHAGITNGFRVYSPDGAEWTTIVGDTISLGWDTYFDLTYSINHEGVTGNGADTVGFGGAALFGTGIPANFSEVSYQITIGPIDAQYHKDQICLDSSFYPPTGVWKWAGPVVFPDWDGPHCFTIFDPNAPTDPSNIVLSPDSLHFDAVEGSSSPPAQIFDLLTDQDPFNFTLNENIGWVYISPIQGTAPSSITTTINTTGLTAGTYLDSIEVVAPEADNSPQWVKVSLTVAPPPPVISASPEEFYFNAVAGGDNPDDKILTVANVGGGSLNWTAGNSESWLTIAPGSGTDSGSVILSVDITGLGFDNYEDTITISDPAAMNDPVKVPVYLSVGSDLPLIEVDSAFNYLITTPGVFSVPDRDIIIRNGGAGTMNYTLTENSNRIFSLSDTIGTATDTVIVGFKISGFVAGENDFDTLWVHSDEAVNSPFPVVFQFHYVNNPAEIYLNRDTLELNVYECSMGWQVLMPQDNFQITNVSGGEPFEFELLYESELFTVNSDFGEAPQVVTVTANDLELPIGSYYDAIQISAINAINSPQQVIVRYNVLEGVAAPEIYVSKNDYLITARENEGPILEAPFHIANLHGGCMEWTIDNNIPWILPSQDSGNVIATVWLNILADGMILGDYEDSLQVIAPSAINNPQTVSFLLRIWRFTADFNYDGEINIIDLVAMVEYFFNDGPGPVPEWRVADLNCDGEVNIADLVYFVDYAFNGGPIPCGNPY